MFDTREQILEEARELGHYTRRNVDMFREDFVAWCNHVGTPWTKEIHAIHQETFDSNNIVNWSNKTRFRGHSLPWHADNPWNEHYRFPLRAFWAEKVPNPEKDILYYLHITNWFEDQDASTKEYFRNLEVLTQDYKRGCQPYWSDFVKKHPVTGKESFNWGAMAIDTKVFGLSPDEGIKFPHMSYTMAIQRKGTRELISHQEIETWFADMVNDKYMYAHHWNEKDLSLMDNWVSLHYIGSTNFEGERLLWRKTILQPWQKIIG
jgi:alpha-ketoglutarate-dependent taurine dioxygenase